MQGKGGQMAFPNDGQQVTHQVYQGEMDFGRAQSGLVAGHQAFLWLWYITEHLYASVFLPIKQNTGVDDIAHIFLGFNMLAFGGSRLFSMSFLNAASEGFLGTATTSVRNATDLN